MIWNKQSRYEDETFVSYVSEEINSVCSEASHVMSKDCRREIARTISDFLRMEHPVPNIATEYIILLVARALWAVGDEQAARRLIASKSSELDFSMLYTDVVFTSDISLSLWRMILSSRTVRPFPLTGTKNGGIWVIDMQCAVTRAEDRLELTLFRVVNVVLEEIAALWDHARGNGILGLRRVNDMASAMLKCPRKSGKTKAMSAEIQKHCVDKLQSLGKERGWKKIQYVISFDL